MKIVSFLSTGVKHHVGLNSRSLTVVNLSLWNSNDGWCLRHHLYSYSQKILRRKRYINQSINQWNELNQNDKADSEKKTFQTYSSLKTFSKMAFYLRKKFSFLCTFYCKWKIIWKIYFHIYLPFFPTKIPLKTTKIVFEQLINEL